MLKGILDLFNKKSRPDSAAQEPSQKNELITVYDAYGRELKITRQEWRDKVMMPSLKTSWNDPDKLYGFIYSALNDGFFSEIQDATKRLLSIDPIPERSHTIRGIVLMKNGHLDSAEEVLREGMKKTGETGSLLTNLAKVYAEKGDTAQSDAILWRAIQADPNQENGLGWWAALRSEKEGPHGYVNALKEACLIPGSWRPQIWLARHYLESKQIDGALQLYQTVLANGNYGSDALMMISGDLGNNGHVDRIPPLIAKRYLPERDGPYIGMNLLQAYLTLGHVEEGQAMLKQLYKLEMPPFKQHFDRFAAEFQKLEEKKAVPQPISDPDSLEIETIALEWPVWYYGLRDPEWLFSKKAEHAPKVTCITFSKISQTDSLHAEEQREEDIGRLTRAIPLYLAEAIHFWTSLKSQAFLPIVKGGGPVVPGTDSNDAELCRQLASQSDYLVSGSIDVSTENWVVNWRLWDCKKEVCLADEKIITGAEKAAEAVLNIEQKLLGYLGGASKSPIDDFYSRPSVAMMTPYLVELGQSLTLTLAANDLITSERFWGERNMLEWPLHMALEWPTAEVPKLMYVSGLAKAMDYRSTVLSEFNMRTEQFLKDAHHQNSVAAWFAPLIWKTFDMKDKLSQHRSGMSGGQSIQYNEWVTRVINEGE